MILGLCYFDPVPVLLQLGLKGSSLFLLTATIIAFTHARVHFCTRVFIISKLMFLCKLSQNLHFCDTLIATRFDRYLIPNDTNS